MGEREREREREKETVANTKIENHGIKVHSNFWGRMFKVQKQRKKML